MGKKKKVRVDMRKNRSKPPRERGWTRGFQDHGYKDEATRNDERVRTKGDLSRKRTIMQDVLPGEQGDPARAMPSAAMSECLKGRVLKIHGLQCVIETEGGKHYRCAVRRLLKNLVTEERSIVTTGDIVWFRPTPDDEGMIEGIEPRHGVLTRASRNREHVLVANVDQLAIIVSLVEPELKPHLIDRYIASAMKGSLQPIICLNKADKIDPADYQTLVGYYSQLGITTILTSATTRTGIDRMAEVLSGKATVFSGQSGVGKSSLLNALQPGLGLRVREVSGSNQKGKHTTTTSELLRLDCGGWVVDTPGVRQFELWDTIPEEVEGYFIEFRPYVALCGFPDCTHTHEDRCAVKRAVSRQQLSERRYVSYLGMRGDG